MKAKTCVGLSLLLVLLLSTTAFANAEIGGEVKTKTMTMIKEENKFDTVVQEYLTLEVLIPQSKKTSAYAELDLRTEAGTQTGANRILQNGELISSVKKLYVKHRFNNFDVSIGRQPISWSFGSLLNPVDYNLGAEAMEETGSAKYVDAVETYYPINWNTSITAVTSLEKIGVNDINNNQVADHHDQIEQKAKYGLRGRTLINGYDLTANYIQQAGGDKQRLGVTAKGDLGPVSVYGAGSYYLELGEPIYLVGTDYSFFPVSGNNRLMFQLEYLKDEAGVVRDILSAFTGPEFLLPKDMDLILGMISYEINDFSSFKLMGIYYPDDRSGLVIPEYNNNLGNSLQFTMRGSWFVGDEQDTFGPKDDPITARKINGNLEMTLSYSF